MRKENLKGDLVFVLHEFLSPEECRQYIELSEGEGFDDAPITTSVGFTIRKNVRNNTRVMIDDTDLANSLWGRAKEHMPPEWWYRKPVGLNERFRFYRYEPGQRFVAHSDGAFDRGNGERSELSFLIYLNEEFTGGETVFCSKEKTRVRPVTGMALVFEHRQLHEGAVVEKGTKYVMRTDVMYSAN